MKRTALEYLTFVASGVVAGLVSQWLHDGGAEAVAVFVLALVPNI